MDLYDSLIEFVDSGALARGTVYAAQGKSQIISDDGQHIEAVTEGSGRNSYTEWVEYELDGRDLIAFSGECTCPVGYNCKHCVSAFLISRHLFESRQSEASSRWRSVLDAIAGPEGEEGQPLALMLEFIPPSRPDPRIPAWKQQTNGAVNLMVRKKGKSGRWIKTGAAISDFRYGPPSGVIPEQGNAISELVGAAELGSYFAPRDQIALQSLRSTIFPPLLMGALATGVQLIDADTGRPVVVSDEPAELIVQAQKNDDGVTLTAGVSHSTIAGPAVGIGQPTQGFVCRMDGQLYLVWAAAPNPAWERISTQSVQIPKDQVPLFERDYLPRLINKVAVNSTWVPEAPKPTLHLQLVHQRNGMNPQVRARWEWSYEAEGLEPRRAPLWDTARGPEERQIVARATDVVREYLPEIVGDRLQATSILEGTQLLQIDAMSQALREAGIEVESSDFVYTQAKDVAVGIGMDESRDWLDLDVNVEVGGTKVPIGELMKALADDLGYMYVGNEYVDLSTEEFARLAALIAEAKSMDNARRGKIRVPKIRVSWWQELLDLGLISASQNRWLESLQQLADAAPIELPAGLNATLRPYQREGFEWLARLQRAGLGGVLADDMGLGKTIQILSVILSDFEHDDARLEPAEQMGAGAGEEPDAEARGVEVLEPGGAEPARGPWLVVAPTSVVGNWVSEAAKFAPSLQVHAVSGTRKARSADLVEEAAGADVVVTSYALLRLDADQYADLGIRGLVLDEAQNVKNANSKGFAAAMSLNAPTTFAVTGTPIENNLGELWAMFALAAPGLLGSLEQFRRTFAMPIERAAGLRGGAEAEAEDARATLQKRISQFFLRRTKNQVALDLPPKQEQVIKLDLEPAHRALYDEQLRYERKRVLRLDEESDRFDILASLTRLRQLAIDPRLIDPDSTEPPSKLNELVPMLESLTEEGHTALVFSQFTRFLKLIAQRLDELGIKYLYLDGATKNRAELISKFADGAAPIFLISLKAGGTGLNLTMADYAILTDPWWNPAAEEQAVDRAHRIGQSRPVHVYRLVSAGTIEEKVLALQESKRKLISVVGDGEIGGAKLDAAELRELLED